MPPAKCDKAKNKIEIILDTKTVFMCYFIFNLNLRLAQGGSQYGRELSKELFWKVKNYDCCLSFDDVDSNPTLPFGFDVCDILRLYQARCCHHLH